MLRLILLVALVLAAAYLVEALARGVRQSLHGPGRTGPERISDRGGASSTHPRAANREEIGGELVACRRCGVYTPTSSVLWHGKDGPYCSEACRRRAMAVS